MKTVKITNLAMNKTEAEKRVAKLNEKFGGKTYMKLEFVGWPAGGSFDVGVKGYADSEEELVGLVLDLFATELMG